MNGYPYDLRTPPVWRCRPWLAVLAGLAWLWLPAQAVAAESPSAARVDVRLIVDVSASMGRTDPENHRGDALGLLLRLLPDDGEAGVWTYGKFVNMLVKHGRSDGLWKENAVILTGNLASVGRRADLLDAVDQASWDRNVPGAGAADLILLTDGRLDVSDDPDINAAQQRRLLGELAPELAAAGFRVHTLALSAQADADLLGQLAALTGGYHGRLASPRQLPAGLLDLLGWVAAPATLPVAPGGRFQVAPGVRELTVLRLGGGLDQPVTLVDPSGARLDRLTPRTRVRWHVGEHYQLATLNAPAPGLWRFEGMAGGGGRVLAYGDLAVAYEDLPGTLFPGGLRTFSLTLQSDGEVVDDAEFLGLLDLSARLVGPDGVLPLVVEPAADGRYRVNLLGPHAEGDYRLETRVWGPTFTQTLALPLALRNPLNIEVRPVEDGFVLWTRVEAAELDHDRLRLSALVKRPPGAARLLPLERLPAGLWKLTVPGARGVVEVELDLKGNYLNERAFELRTQPIRVVLPVAQVQHVNLGLDGRPVLVASAAKQPLGSAWDGAPLRTGAAADGGRQGADSAAGLVAGPPAVERSPAPPDDAPAPALPGWLAIVAGLINLALGVSIWWFVGAPRLAPSGEETLANLRSRLGIDDSTGADADTGAEPATPAVA